MLKLASGNGQLGVFFNLFSSIIWQTSDPKILHTKSIISWIYYYGLSSKIPSPLNIDVERRPWPKSNRLRSLIKGILCINLLHISQWKCKNALFEASKNYLDTNTI